MIIMRLKAYFSLNERLMRTMMCRLTAFFVMTLAFGALLMGQNRQNSSKPQNLGKAVNSQYEETVPVITPDGKTLYFVRKNHPQNNYGKESSADSWYSTYNVDRNIWSYARRMGNDFNRRRFNSIESISPDGNTALIRGAYDGDKFKEEGFSFCKKEGNTWGVPKALAIKNFDKMVKGVYSGAFLSNSGKVLLLYFSEKQDDLLCDLYISRLQDNTTWSEPMPLGTGINSTEYSEASPYLAADGKTLYFASDRPGGQGGYDIYKAERQDDTWTKWSPPVNLGPPINTKGFDAYYSVSASGEWAYLLSTNKSYGKNDIVRVKLADFQKPAPVVLMTGQVVDSETGQPIRATINFVAVPNAAASTTVTSSPVDGTYKMTLPYGNRYRIEATAIGYKPLTLEINLSQPKDYEEMGRDLVMRPDKPVAVEVDPNAGGNDNDGNDGNQGNNGESVDLEEIVNNTADPYDPNAGGVGGMQELDPFADSEARSDELFIYDASTRISSLYFDTGKVRVKADSKEELDRMVALMKGNANLLLMVQGHTDNVGGRRFNQDLSEYRARMVRAYMIANGVAPFRLLFVGYGMEHPAESNATETGRTQNRRVEFHVLAGQ